MTDVLDEARAWLADDPDPDTRAELAGMIERRGGGTTLRHLPTSAIGSPAGSSSAQLGCVALSVPDRTG